MTGAETYCRRNAKLFLLCPLAGINGFSSVCIGTVVNQTVFAAWQGPLLIDSSRAQHTHMYL